MRNVIIFTSAFIFSAVALAYQPCATNADFCVKFVNESSSPATVASSGSGNFSMPGVQGLIIPPHSTTAYIPVFGGPQDFMLGEDAPWILTMSPAYSPLYLSCTMLYNDPVVFQPMDCGAALSQANPYDLVVQFNLNSKP